LSGTPLVVWRQLLALIVLSLVLLRSFSQARVTTAEVLNFCLIGVSFLWFVYSLVLGFSVTRSLYAFFSYVGLSSALVFHSVVSNSNLRDKLSKVVLVVLLISCFGLMLDYFTDFLLAIPRAEQVIDIETSEIYLRRASFFFGASTLVFPFLSFGFITALNLRARLSPTYLAFVWIIVTLGLFLTISRAAIVAWCLLNLLMMVVFFGHSVSAKRFLRTVGLVLVILFVVGDDLDSYLLQSDVAVKRISDPFNLEDESNSHRVNRWRLGLSLFTFQPEFFLGHGLGSTMGQVPDVMPVHTHYESSFFQALHEGGVVGLWVRYFPAILAFWLFFRRRWRRREVGLQLYAAWLFVYIFVVFLAPTAGAYHNQLLYYYVCGVIISNSKSHKLVVRTLS
jgi:hypothetical protein